MTKRSVLLAVLAIATGCATEAQEDNATQPVVASPASSTTTQTTPPSTTSTTTLSPTEQARRDDIERRNQMAADATEMWVAFNDAVRTGDGATAASMITTSSVEWLDEIRVLAQTGSRTDFEDATFPQNVRAIDLRRGLGTEVQDLTTAQETFAALVELGTIVDYDTDEHELFAISDLEVSVRRGIQGITNLFFEEPDWRFDFWRWDNTFGYWATVPRDADISIVEFYTGLPISLTQYLDLAESEGLLDPPPAD